MKRSLLLMIVMAGSLSLVSGCLVSAGLTTDDPQYGEVQTQEAPPQNDGEVTPPPRSGYVWIRGHWKWYGGRWHWQQGRWARAQAGYQWVPGHWARTPAGYRWVPGHWRR